jgi:hypothetical protein
MISSIITYLIIGVAFNFIFDLLVNLSGSEEHRFTLVERIAMTFIWPLGVLLFVLYFVRVFFGSNNDK